MVDRCPWLRFLMTCFLDNYTKILFASRHIFSVLGDSLYSAIDESSRYALLLLLMLTI